MRPIMRGFLLIKYMNVAVRALALSVAGLAQAATWEYSWSASAGQPEPTVEISHYKFGKTWAYAVEIDDNPAHVMTVVQPLLARYQFTDAPPGVSGGKVMPFVGGVGVIVASAGTTNPTNLSWDDLRKLQTLGWGMINHSYFHAGRTYSNPPEILTQGQIDFDLFWSQTIFAAETGGRAPTHHIFPNGYTGYTTGFAKAGLRSGSRVSGSGPREVYGPKAKMQDICRAYLDEGYWSNNGKGNPLHAFPESGPALGDFVLDFTHGINKDPESANHKRWVERLNLISSRYGAAGNDSMWVAPSGDVLEYVAARQAAKLGSKAGKISVTLPDGEAGASLTLHIRGVPANTKLPVPEGGAVYQKDGEAWVTTPMIGKPGCAPPMPAVKRIYAGPVKELTWDNPVQIAAIRLQQSGPINDSNYRLKVDAQTKPEETKSLLPEPEVALEKFWGKWLLYGPVPNAAPIAASKLTVTPHKVLTAMEVWAVE